MVQKNIKALKSIKENRKAKPFRERGTKVRFSQESKTMSKIIFYHQVDDSKWKERKMAVMV